MPDINKYRIAVMVLAVAVVALVIVLLVQSGGNVPSAQNLEQQLASTTAQVPTSTGPATAGGAAAGTGRTSGTSRTGAGTGSASGGTKTATVGSIIHLLAPAASEMWTIGTQNTISWTPAAGVTGQIELLNASTRAEVGVIIPQLGPNQTYYTWNTRDLLLSRTNPSKTTVQPGAYLIRIAFDGNELAPVTSAAITIVQ